MKYVLFFLVISINAYCQDTTDVKKPTGIYHALELSFIGLNTLDAITTYQGIAKGGRELNPFVRSMIENKPLFITIKATFTFGGLYLIRQLQKRDNKTGMIYLISANVLYSIVVARNISIVMKL